MSVAAIVTGLGHGLVSDGLGGGTGGYAAATTPGYIEIRERSKRLHVGDVAEFYVDFLTYDDEPLDPDRVWVVVEPTAGDEFEIDYADGDDAADQITRRGEGLYTLRIDLTSARGTGIAHFTIHASGTLQAVEPGQFIVRTVRV